MDDPGTWNMYPYVAGDPINNIDPDGLAPCGDGIINSGAFAGQTLREVRSGTSGEQLMAQLIYNEAGTILDTDLTYMNGYKRRTHDNR